MEEFTKKYFKNRNSNLKLANNRYQLALREIDTIEVIFSKHISSYGKTSDFSISKMNIIDIGSGDQFLKAPILERGANYTGIDIDTCNFEEDTLPYESNSFDMVICLAVIEHLQDPSLLIQECKRVIKKGGLMIFSSPNINFCGNNFWNDPTHVRPYNQISIRKLFEMFELKKISVYPNLRKKKKIFYGENKIYFRIAKWLFFFPGSSNKLIPRFLKGSATGLFILCTNE